MMSFEVTTQPQIQDILKLLPDGPRREQILSGLLDKGRFVFQRHVMNNMPETGTGAMRQNTSTTHSGLEATVDVNKGYAVVVDQGASAHPIYPRLATLLRFVPLGAVNPAARLTGRARRGQEGVYVFARAVNHPGQVAQHFMQRGLEDGLPEFQHLMQDAAGGVFSAR